MEVSRRNNGSATHGSSALQAWGPVADGRWKELLAIVEAEDILSSELSTPVEKSGSRSSSPVLLQSNSLKSRALKPSGSADNESSSMSPKRVRTATANDIPEALPGKAADSASLTTTKSIHRRRPLLILFPRHNQQDTLSAYRSMILAERYSHVTS